MENSTRKPRTEEEKLLLAAYESLWSVMDDMQWANENSRSVCLATKMCAADAFLALKDYVEANGLEESLEDDHDTILLTNAVENFDWDNICFRPSDIELEIQEETNSKNMNSKIIIYTTLMIFILCGLYLSL